MASRLKFTLTLALSAWLECSNDEYRQQNNWILCSVLIFCLLFLSYLLISVCDTARARSVPKWMFNISGGIWHSFQITWICTNSQMATFLTHGQRRTVKRSHCAHTTAKDLSSLLSTTHTPKPYPPKKKKKEQAEAETRIHIKKIKHT